MNDRAKEYTQKAIQQLKACGQEIIKSADKMIGGYDFQCNEVSVIITINPEKKMPTIDVNQELIPDPDLWVNTTE